MRRVILLTFLGLGLYLVNGCSSIIVATTDGPIQNNDLDRSLGNYIDDQQIETVILVNIKHLSEAIKESHISVISFNGVVLIVGQVPSQIDRTQITAVARDVKGVRQVHNQLSVAPNISTLVASNDSWLTSKVKTQFLLNAGESDFSNIKVVTENSVVYLMGTVTHNVANHAVEIARTVGGVQRIVKVFEYPE